MNRLQITDNQRNEKNPLKFADWGKEQGYKTKEDLLKIKSDLEKIANVRINKLSLDDTPNLLVFPQNFNRYGDKIGDSHIISLRGDEIATGNIMGFVGVGNTQLDIKSRFAENCKEDYFLHYMLQKVFAINLFKMEHTISKEPVFDFLLYMFPHYLKKAVAQGVFKKYRRFEYNDANIRGPIDVSRHIRQNIPFRGTVAYSAREHSYDNELTQLVRHTLEYIRTKPQGTAILNSDADTKTAVGQIVMATQTYNIRERQRVVNQNLRPVRHPYFSAYTDLQRLCLQILRHESIKYGQETDKVYGVLFDGAWLWEEYLNKVFEEKHLPITHAKNKTGENGIAIFADGKKCYYPDFYKKDENEEKTFVLDAKYKRLSEDKDELPNDKNYISICREDLFQMITYMYVLPAKHCALLYPIEKDEKCEVGKNVKSSTRRTVKGQEGDICGIGIRISTATEMSVFWNEMKGIEEELNNEIDNFTKTN